MRLTAKLSFQSLLLLSLFRPGGFGEVQAGPNAWTSNGPKGDGGDVVVALAVDPSNSATVYAATHGGLFRSTDSGTNWSEVIAGFTESVEAVAIDSSDTDIIYAGTGPGPPFGGVLKSTNAGRSWTPLNAGLPRLEGVRVLAIAPSDTGTIYAGTALTSGMFKSTNGGGSWVAVNTGMPTYTGLFGVVGFYSADSLVVDPLDSRIVYAGMSSAGIFKSTNGGGSWSAVNNGPNRSAKAIAIDPFNTNTVYAGDFGVRKSTNGGETWSTTTPGQPSFVLALTIDPSNNNTIYAGTSFAGVFKSTDGGGSWTAFNIGLSNFQVLALAIDPSASSTIYAGTFGGGVFQQQFNGGVPANPEITSADFDGRKKLTISGTTFLGSPRVMINGMDRTEFVRSSSDSGIKLKGKASALGLHSGDNTVQVVATTGAVSNVFILRL